MFGIRTHHRRVRECAVCRSLFYGHDERLCPHCIQQLPYTHFWQQPESALVRGAAEAFHGAQWVLPLCFYSQTGHMRHLVWMMKYQGRLDVAYALGQLYARTLKDAGVAITFDAIVPVPIHWRKLVQRGYNQCTLFARGIASLWGIPVVPALRRRKHGKSQTTCSSPDARRGNVRGSFAFNPKCNLSPGAHVLVVDDVLTTGATMDECVAVLQQQGLTYSIGSLAVAPGLCRGMLDAAPHAPLDPDLFPPL